MSNAKKKKIPLQLNISMPAVATDGNAIQIDDNGNVNLVFFQIAQTNENAMTANAVAHIRLNTDELEKLSQAIVSSLDKRKKKTDSKPKD